MAKCVACGKRSRLISAALGACADCLRAGDPRAVASAQATRRRSRAAFGLPAEAPHDADGIACGLCAQGCRMGEGQRGFCGIRINRGGIVQGGDERRAQLQFYHDPLPTNCVAAWFCPAGTGCGYPRYSHCSGPERGYANLAVFYQACGFDCLFCQNWHFREASRPEGGRPASELAEAVDERTACICYFGGDPAPQARHALEASRLALEKRPGGILRICWETNGAGSPKILDEMIDLSLESGGCIKFDLKAFSEPLHQALCGASNRRTLSNFRRAAERIPQRREPPLVMASTLLVPGYIDTAEVEKIARFIAAIDPSIPYSLLGFHPDFLMNDLPTTSTRHAEEAEAAARAAGLERIHIGNRHLLGMGY